MSNTESKHPRDGDGSIPASPDDREPGLQDLMARIRLELTGDAEHLPQMASGTDEVPVAIADQSVQASGADARELSVEEVLARMRLELKRRRGESVDAPAASSNAVSADGRLPRWHPSATPLPSQPTYVLADLLRFSDGDFVDQAFRILLQRPASVEEKASYLSALRSGGIGKVEILGNVRFSDEGMQQCVHVDGLLLPYKMHRWRRIPVFGWVLAMAIAIFRLPRLFAHLQKMEATSAQDNQQLGRVLNDLAQAAEAHRARLQAESDSRARLEDRLRAQMSKEAQALALAVNRLHEQFAGQASTLEQIERSGDVARQVIARIESGMDKVTGHQADLEVRLASGSDKITELEAEQKTRLASLMGKIAELEAEQTARLEAGLADRAGAHVELEKRLQAHLPTLAKLAGDSAENRRAVRDIERRLMAFFDHTSRHAAGTPAAPSAGASSKAEGSGLLDAHYVAFEDTFRGTREDIKTRARHYLATLSDAGVGNADGLVVDLGCGRGEWLEVLTENGYTCLGVDLNRVMIGEALALGLDVVESDAVAYLRGLASDSVSAITSMHLVEHLPYEVLIRLLDEALRVLHPGGVLILETPNPENLTVGSFWFYMDPTHRNPIPPTLLQWVVQARGFECATIDRLTQNRGVADIQPVNEEVGGSSQLNKIIGMLTAAPDYAIVTRKPGASVVEPQESLTG